MTYSWICLRSSFKRWIRIAGDWLVWTRNAFITCVSCLKRSDKPTVIHSRVMICIQFIHPSHTRTVVWERCNGDWLPANLIQRLQSVQNAAARLIFRIRRSLPQRWSAFTGCASQNVSPSNWQLWRIDPSTAPLRPTYSHVSPVFLTWRPWRPLRSSTSHRLDVPPIRLSTVGKRAFPLSGATVWNDLPLHVASAPSLTVFRQRLKTFLFSRSYQDTIIWLVCYYHHSSLLSGHPWSLQ